jgi:hypothetical protein
MTPTRRGILASALAPLAARLPEQLRGIFNLPEKDPSVLVTVAVRFRKAG